jgi:hypothetical protein
MYTATKLGDSANKELQRRIVTVQFDNGEGHVFVKDFSFSLTSTAEQIKRIVQSYLDEINFVPPVIDDLTPTPDPTPEPPTQAELDRQEWEEDLLKLEKVQKLITLGVLTGNETQVTTLRTKVTTNFKPTYI